jgi:hypothetical protein
LSPFVTIFIGYLAPVRVGINKQPLMENYYYVPIIISIICFFLCTSIKLFLEKQISKIIAAALKCWFDVIYENIPHFNTKTYADFSKADSFFSESPPLIFTTVIETLPVLPMSIIVVDWIVGVMALFSFPSGNFISLIMKSPDILTICIIVLLILNIFVIWYYTAGPTPKEKC